MSVALFIVGFVADPPDIARAQMPPGAATTHSLFTAAQATVGEGFYRQYCSACHGDHLDDGDFGGPPLRGSYFRGHWAEGTVGPLFAFMKGVMPPDNPGELSDGEYADILAYILQYNGYRPGMSELPTDPAAQARLKLSAPSR